MSIRRDKWVTLATSVVSLLWCGCVSLTPEADKKEEKPKITKDMPFNQVVDIAIKFGGDALEQAKKRAKQENLWSKLKEQSELAVRKGYETEAPEIVLNAAHLYQISAVSIDPQLVRLLMNSERGEVRQIGWKFAAVRPSKEIKQLVEKELTRAIYENRDTEVLIPAMAQAVRANRLTSVYSFLKAGLLTTGDSEFARVMIEFSNAKTSDDLMDYLATASVEDLRQLNQTMVNSQTAFLILTHLVEHPVTINHPRYNQLFLYAVSRNPALREVANAVLEKQFSSEKELMAVRLAQLPVWIQIAYIEGVRDHLNSNISLFLNQLQQVTSHKEVLEEISELKY